MLHAARNTPTFASELLKAMRNDFPLYVLTGAFLVAGLFYVVSSQHTMMGMLDHYLIKWSFHFGFAGPFFVFTIGVIHIAWRTRGRKRLAYRTMFAPRRLGRYVAGTIFLMTGALLFTSAFSSIKTGFPRGRSFPYDVIHADIDKALHFGVDPFHILYRFAEHTWLLRMVEANYSVLWFIICYFALYFVMTSPRTDRIRLRFAFTWFGSWIVVGTAMASQWLSAGPVYYGRVTGDTERFAELTAFVATTTDSLGSAYNFQEYLWSLHASGQLGLGSGISAFPSMHVALITVIALFAGEYSTRLGILAWAYTGIILLSSVYLGWHYAIDGYVSMITITALYWALRKLVPTLARLRWRRSAPQTDDAYANTM